MRAKLLMLQELSLLKGRLFKEVQINVVTHAYSALVF